jgi:hypothetical protein
VDYLAKLLYLKDVPVSPSQLSVIFEKKGKHTCTICRLIGYLVLHYLVQKSNQYQGQDWSGLSLQESGLHQWKNLLYLGGLGWAGWRHWQSHLGQSLQYHLTEPEVRL